MFFHFCRFHPEDQSLAEIRHHLNARLCVSEEEVVDEEEWRDGRGQFAGPGCFNYPLLCRWVRAHYLSLALSPSHDLSSTFIRKPSAPLAKQRKKGGQRRGFTAVTLPHFPLISLNLSFFT